MKIDYIGKCDIGSKRKVNQDAIAMFSGEDTGIFVVADGMGGHAKGEKASECIVNEISQWWQCYSEKKYDFNFQKMLQSIEQTIMCANQKIYETYNKEEVCGSTVVVLFIYKDKYGIVYAGDSRCYSYSKRKLKQITIDEIWENQFGLSDSLRNDLNHPNRGKLVNAVGIKPDIRPRVITDYISEETIFLLCSDGFYRMCPELYIKSYIKKCKDLKKMQLMADKMIDKVYQNGAIDNVSVIIVSCKSQ